MPVQVDITKCRGCNTCEDVCPEGAITWDVINAVPIVDAERCVECGLCVVACDEGAMEILNCKVVDKN